MKKVFGAITLLLLLSFYSKKSGKENQTKRPNFIFIIADDMRWDAMGVVQKEQGEKARFPWFKTPHLDALASESLRFRNAMVVTSVCSPSRAEFLTGRYSHYNGVANNQTVFPVENTTYASCLQAAGYTTGYIGKWHMSKQEDRPYFDFTASFRGQGKYPKCNFYVNGKSEIATGWVDDVSTDYAIEFIKSQKDTPFALSIGFKSPHIPFIPPARAKDRFEGAQIGSVPNFYNDAIYKPNLKDSIVTDRERVLLKRGMVNTGPREEQPLWALDYFRCISAIDENIGRLLATLKEQGALENTVIVFTSDNGYFMGEHGLGDKRGDKRAAYEESMRVPLLIRYPGKKRAGEVSDDYVLNIDLAPTFLDMAGVKIPKSMQGKSWKKTFTNPKKKLRDDFFYEYFFENKFAETPTILAYRDEDYKIIFYPDHKEWVELYDLKNDPYETKNLALSPNYAKLLKKMQLKFEKEQQEVGYVFPEFAEEPWPESYVFKRKNKSNR